MSPAARLRAFYFLYYGSVGTYLPFFAEYLRGLGFSGAAIGTVQMVGPLVSAPAALSWAAAADRMRAPARALRLAALWAAGAAALLPFARTPLAVGAVLLLVALADRAIVPLVDSVSMEFVHTHREHSYARLRLFGSLGFISLAFPLGLLLWARGERAADWAVPAAFLACVAGYALVARRLPSGPPGGAHSPRGGLRALLADPGLRPLLLAATLHWGATAPFHLLLGVHVRDLGLASWVTGAATGTAVAAEIAALLLFPRLQVGRSTRALFALAFGGSALRWLLLSWLRSPLALVAVQLLHALTFGLFWAAAVRAMGWRVPAQLRATGQALFSAVVFGAGNVIGYQLAGRGYDHYRSAGPLFAWAALAELLALAVALAMADSPAAPAGEVAPPPGEA